MGIIPFVPFLGTDQVIEKGPTYRTGGVTTLMSVGDPLEGLTDCKPCKAGLYAAGGYVAGKVLGVSPLILALVGAGLAYLIP